MPLLVTVECLRLQRRHNKCSRSQPVVPSCPTRPLANSCKNLVDVGLTAEVCSNSKEQIRAPVDVRECLSVAWQ